MFRIFKKSTYNLFEIINDDLVPANTYKRRDILDAFMDHAFPHITEPDKLRIEERNGDYYLRYSFEFDGELRRFVLNKEE